MWNLQVTDNAKDMKDSKDTEDGFCVRFVCVFSSSDLLHRRAKGQLGVRQQLHPGGIDDPHPREQSGCESSVRSSEAATPHPFAAGFVPDLSRVLVLDTTRSVGKAVSVCLMPPNFSPGLVT